MTAPHPPAPDRRSKTRNIAYAVFFFIVGVIGVLVPIMPQVPFFIMSALFLSLVFPSGTARDPAVPAPASEARCVLQKVARSGAAKETGEDAAGRGWRRAPSRQEMGSGLRECDFAGSLGAVSLSDEPARTGRQ